MFSAAYSFDCNATMVTGTQQYVCVGSAGHACESTYNVAGAVVSFSPQGDM
jgi:hypothetical protein